MAAARKARGLTQVELAEALGVTQKTIDRYERRAKKLDIAFVADIAKALDVTVDALVGDDDSQMPKPATNALEQRIARLRQLPRKEQEVVIRMLDGLLGSSHSP
jgi:transcriptional regulator with XRE-family HTH domain